MLKSLSACHIIKTLPKRLPVLTPVFSTVGILSPALRNKPTNTHQHKFYHTPPGATQEHKYTNCTNCANHSDATLTPCISHKMSENTFSLKTDTTGCVYQFEQHHSVLLAYLLQSNSHNHTTRVPYIAND